MKNIDKASVSKANNPRVAAISVLSEWKRGRKYINISLDASLRRFKGKDDDRALFAALVYGVVERGITLDAQIEHLTGRSVESLDTATLTALELGLYQLYYLDRVPPYAAVNETVAVAPHQSKTLVNAVLRRAVREGKPIFATGSAGDIGSVRELSLLHSLPEWIIEEWMRDYPDDYPSLCASVNSRPPVTLRVNTLRTDVPTLLARLCDDKSGALAAVQNPICPDMIDITNAGNITELFGYDSGLWFVQDAASRICAAAAGAVSGDVVIDVCSAPGGKSFSLAIDMKNEGVVYAFDLHEKRARLVQEGALRLGLSIIKAAAHDARMPDEALIRRADVVLCDVPCSGLGVIAKKPDIRYKDKADVMSLPDVQSAILSSSAEYVKPGGVLVYSTCTLRRAENEDVVDTFLENHGGFEPCGFSVANISAPRGQITLMPHKNGSDGFFIAKFKRKSDIK